MIRREINVFYFFPFIRWFSQSVSQSPREKMGQQESSSDHGMSPEMRKRNVYRAYKGELQEARERLEEKQEEERKKKSKAKNLHIDTQLQ
jgi:hypothetical protein